MAQHVLASDNFLLPNATFIAEVILTSFSQVRVPSRRAESRPAWRSGATLRLTCGCDSFSSRSPSPARDGTAC